MSDVVEIVEVGPRDGLQNEKRLISTADKVALIEMLAASGLCRIEATSFVSPKWVPQMADAAEVMARVPRRPGLRYSVLTPNLKGYEAARAAGADEVAIFVAASEAFSRANLNATIAESLERLRPVAEAAAADGVALRGYVSVVTDCPFEGEVAPQDVEYEWEAWLRQFETLLKSMYWVSATVHLETELSGKHTFSWQSDRGHVPSDAELMMSCEWEREAGFAI